MAMMMADVMEALGIARGDYLIRVNRLPVSGDQVLQPGDRISITPTKIQGARAV